MEEFNSSAEAPPQTLHLSHLSTACRGSPDHAHLVRFPLGPGAKENTRSRELHAVPKFATDACGAKRPHPGQRRIFPRIIAHFRHPRRRVAIKVLMFSWRVLTTLSHSAWSAWVSGPRWRKDRTLACNRGPPPEYPCPHV